MLIKSVQFCFLLSVSLYSRREISALIDATMLSNDMLIDSATISTGEKSARSVQINFDDF